MATLQEQIKDLKGKMVDRQQKLGTIFQEAGTDFDTSKIKCIDGDSAAKVAAIQALNEEMGDFRKELDQKENLLKISLDAASGAKEEPPAEHKAQDGKPKDFGEQFVKSAAFTQKGAVANLDMDVKTLFQTSAGWAPESARSGLVVEYGTRPIQVADLIPTIPISVAAYKYMEETTFTNNAAEVAAGDTYGEAALVLTERSATVEKVGVWIPVTDEQLEDVPGAQAYVNRRLPFMLRQRLDSQIINGDGNTPNLLGVLNKLTIQTQAKGADPVPDAIYKAITKVQVLGYAFPDAVVLHPNDWQDIRLLRTSDGIYIWGSPSESAPECIWGLNVVKIAAITENTGLVGDFANFSLMGLRRGIDVQISNSHSDYFVKGKQAIRADIRVVVVWLRAYAFASITGI